MKRKESGLKKRWKNSIDLLNRSKYFIFTMFLVLFIMGLVGFMLPQLFEDQVIILLQQIIDKLGDKNGAELMVYIFLNNLQASFFAMMIGVFFGIFPIITALVNGYVIGFTAQFAVSKAGPLILWRLFPHGIFEIPAVIISMGLGLYLGSKLIEEKFGVKDNPKKILIIFLICLIAIPFGAFYFLMGQGLGLGPGLDVSSFTSSQIILMSVMALINLLLLTLLIFIFVIFFKNKNLRKELVDSVWLFILIIVPLLIIAGIIEGLLITIMN